MRTHRCFGASGLARATKAPPCPCRAHRHSFPGDPVGVSTDILHRVSATNAKRVLSVPRLLCCSMAQGLGVFGPIVGSVHRRLVASWREWQVRVLGTQAAACIRGHRRHDARVGRQALGPRGEATGRLKPVSVHRPASERATCVHADTHACSQHRRKWCAGALGKDQRHLLWP